MHLRMPQGHMLCIPIYKVYWSCHLVLLEEEKDIQSIFMTSVSVYFYSVGRVKKNKIFGNEVISCMWCEHKDYRTHRGLSPSYCSCRDFAAIGSYLKLSFEEESPMNRSNRQYYHFVQCCQNGSIHCNISRDKLFSAEEWHCLFVFHSGR